MTITARNTQATGIDCQYFSYYDNEVDLKTSASSQRWSSSVLDLLAEEGCDQAAKRRRNKERDDSSTSETVGSTRDEEDESLHSGGSPDSPLIGTHMPDLQAVDDDAAPCHYVFSCMWSPVNKVPSLPEPELIRRRSDMAPALPTRYQSDSESDSEEEDDEGYESFYETPPMGKGFSQTGGPPSGGRLPSSFQDMAPSSSFGVLLSEWDDAEGRVDKLHPRSSTEGFLSRANAPFRRQRGQRQQRRRFGARDDLPDLKSMAGHTSSTELQQAYDTGVATASLLVTEEDLNKFVANVGDLKDEDYWNKLMVYWENMDK